MVVGIGTGWMSTMHPRRTYLGQLLRLMLYSFYDSFKACNNKGPAELSYGYCLGQAPMDPLFMNTVESVSEHGLLSRMATYERNAAACRSSFFRLRL